MKHTYYFEISKDAELAVDEEGNASEAYLTASFNSDETFYTEEQMLKYIAEISKVPVEHLSLITKEAYEKQIEEESA